MMNERPEGWAQVPPLQVAALLRGVSYAKGEAQAAPAAGLVALLRANNITDSGLVFEDLQHVPVGRVSDAQRLQLGDVVVAMSSGSKSVVGKAAALTAPWSGTFGAFCGALRPHPALDARYFGLYFQTREYRDAISGMSAGTNINNLKRDYFDQLLLPVAPLAEQRRIVAKAEILLEQVRRAKDRLDRVPLILKRFRQAALAAACSGDLSASWRAASGRLDGDDPYAWRRMTVEEVASPEPRSIQSGPFGSNLLHSEFQTEGRLVIGIDNVGDGVFLAGRQHRISESKFQELARYQARPLDVLITVMATVGRCCVVPADTEPAIITKHVYRITCNRTVMEPHFLLCALRGSPALREDMRDQVRGQTRPGINGSILKGLEVPVPPLDEQTEIVRRVDGLFALATAIEQRVERAAARAGRLPQAILSKAFAGELVPTEAELAQAEGRPFEGAAQLLERVRARAAESPTGQRSVRRTSARRRSGAPSNT